MQWQGPGSRWKWSVAEKTWCRGEGGSPNQAYPTPFYQRCLPVPLSAEVATTHKFCLFCCSNSMVFLTQIDLISSLISQKVDQFCYLCLDFATTSYCTGRKCIPIASYTYPMISRHNIYAPNLMCCFLFYAISYISSEYLDLRPREY